MGLDDDSKARLLLDHGADPNAWASFPQEAKFHDRAPTDALQGVTPVGYARRYPDRRCVNTPALAAIIERGERSELRTMKSASALAAAKTVIPWLRWAAVAALVCVVWSNLVYFVFGREAWARRPARLAAVGNLVFMLRLDVLPATVELDDTTRFCPGVVVQVTYGQFKQREADGFFKGPPNFVLDVFPEGDILDYEHNCLPSTRGANYTISVAAAVGDQERIEHLLSKDSSLAKRLNSVGMGPPSYASQGGYLHIVRLLLEHGADPNIPEGDAPDGLALYLACAGNHLEIARLLLEHGANPNAGLDSCMHCVNITRVYHGEEAEPLEQLLRRHGAYPPPYHMTVREMKRAIRDGHEVTRHPEFLGNLMAKRNAKLLDLYLDSDPSFVDRMADELACPWSAALVRRLLTRGPDPNRPDWLGKTFLHACAASGNRSVAAVFLDAGADINARGLEFDETPLAAAVRYEPWCEEADRSTLPDRRRRMDEQNVRDGLNPQFPQIALTGKCVLAYGWTW